eukprot:COSAG06_NODE_60819_length_269_cov_1.358824_1_plen_44_part_01
MHAAIQFQDPVKMMHSNQALRTREWGRLDLAGLASLPAFPCANA